VGHCAQRLGILACLLAPAVARAQLAPVGVPAGAVRVELDGAMDIWDTRYRGGDREPLGADLTSPALGSALLPSLSDADARLGRITGLSGYGLNLGALTTEAQADEGRGYFGLALGLTRAITIFGRMPLVRARVQTAFTLDAAAADAGLNPGGDVQSAFFTQLDASLTALDGRIAGGDFDGDPALKARAQTTLADATALRADLFGLLADPETASPFVPTAASAAGAAVTDRVADLQTALASDFGVTGFTEPVALPTDALTTEDFLAFVSDPGGPIATRTGDSKLTFRGDAEAGVALTLVDHWDRGDRRGGFRAAVEGLVRFPTGSVARFDRLLTLGTGDGQTDVELRITTDLGSGRWGLRAEGGYNRQLAADYLLRVAPITQPLAGIDRLTVVHRDPGDIASLAVRPFFRLAPTLALQASAGYWSRKADEADYATADDEIAGVDASVLARDTKASATTLGFGVTYSNQGRLRAGGKGLPVDASWAYERVVRASGGIVPNRHSFRARFRVYFGLF
jgi:hypothetical protein